MPVHLPAQNRRQFLFTLGAGFLTCSAGAFAKDAQQSDIIYLLNDTHIGEKHPENSPVPSHLRKVVSELVNLEQKPACVLINGDLALRDGQPGDYRHFAKLIRPLREAKIDTHLTLGNHDERDVFYTVMQEEQPETPPVKSKHISVVQTQYANFFLLDSLHKTMVTQGTLGAEQRTWLANALDAHADKPAIIMTHHNPRLGGDPNHFPGGLTDSVELWEILAPRKQVKAYIHGHIHDRGNAEHKGIHIINTPATSYVANPKQSTTGWTVAKLSPEGITLTTRTSDDQHPWNHQSKTLTWR
ncbi:metallophosphoesterase family protein [Gimesia panareensis]|uniref:metallophosphoesterase family protein n=1 Tax=Gimesia panareensis TaxID=2527978 RepID=UPI00118A821B|nr:metallophosphoesterase [Gimesia panareensis]QDU52823.1 3',5'-cyclic adenosine monophosphate phosphodiesterase CpdA [Gimesia panareensis]